MCGINGVIYKTQTDKSTVKSTLTVMNNLILHRGPDEGGFFIKTTPKCAVGMAMRRLSIIDLSSGSQPMYSEDKNIAIVFNGEIYNFKTLKTQLIQSGVTFKTTSDTEVILKLYETKGVKAFQDLDGMFALSIYDFNSNVVYIARDFFGEKPLYYSHIGNQFFWASELKSITKSLKSLPNISKDGLNLFFRLTYIPAPYTIYDDIYKLEANHYIAYDLETLNFKTHQIHNTALKPTSQLSFNDAKTEVKQRVFESVENRTIADVPLGTFLSGGVDSSIISYCLSEISNSKIDTFSIGFKNSPYDETNKSQTVAKRINSHHHEFKIDENDLKHNIDSILLNFDEPFADSSSLPSYLIAHKTKTNIKVALTGDGGDEVFGGYNKYYIGKLNNTYTAIVPEKLHEKAIKLSKILLQQKNDSRGYKYKLDKLIKAINYSDNYYWNIIALGLNTNDINTLLSSDYQKQDVFNYYKTKTGISSPKSLNDFKTIDLHMSLEGDMLVKVDRTSMLNSLECRTPFLNRSLFEFTSSLPESYLINKWSKKHILKAAFAEHFPKQFLEKSKQGFGVPVGDWLRSSLKHELIHYSNKTLLNTQQIFNINAITELVNNHLSGKEDNTFKVWAFYCFQKWYTNTYVS